MRQSIRRVMLLLVAVLLNCGSSHAQEVVIVSSLPESITRQAESAFALNLKNQLNYELKLLEEVRSDGLTPGENGLRIRTPRIYVAAGEQSCRYLSKMSLRSPVLCTLLSKRNFQTVFSEKHSARLAAVVIDQPLARQIQVAGTIYSDLGKFGLLARTSGATEGARQDHLPVTFTAYRDEVSLLHQLTTVLSDVDALVAVPDPDIFSRANLRTVLLTAYGYGKPVIGYGKAYVRAGSLISTYSTPEQIVLQVTKLIKRYFRFGADADGMVYSPLYFSIVDNTSVAKSLNFSRYAEFDPAKTYVDEDFLP